MHIITDPEASDSKSINSKPINSKTTSIDIIGLGVSEQAQLSEQALQALNQAEVVLGSERQLATIKHIILQQQIDILPKLSLLPHWIHQNQGRTVAVLASGDPLFYGIGQWFTRHYLNCDPSQPHCINKLRFHPAISSVQVACHLLGLSLQDTQVISLHARPVPTIRSLFKLHQHYVVLTDQYSQPKVLAQECQRAGFEQSTVWVCENLGYQQQQVRQFTVAQLIQGNYDFDPLHITVIFTKGKGGILPEFPGIPDEHFITDSENTDNQQGKGLLSKREVRINILSLLQPQANDVGWDVGAGCGGVAIEWALWNKKGQVYAIEHHQQRLNCLHENQQRFGVNQHLSIVAGRAPQVLQALPEPNVVFIGGSDGDLLKILHYCWKRLALGGRLVASAVTENSKQLLQQFIHTQSTGDAQSVQISVSRGEDLANQLIYRPGLPVTLWKITKTRTPPL